MTVQQLVGATALVQAMHRDTGRRPPGDTTGKARPVAKYVANDGFSEIGEDVPPDPALPIRSLHAAAAE